MTIEANMEAPQAAWRSLGQILVERNLLSAPDLEIALAEELATKRRLVDILVRRGLVTGPDITDALMEQMKALGGSRPVEPDSAARPVAVEQPGPQPAHEPAAPDPEPVAAPVSVPAVAYDTDPDRVVREADARRSTAESRLAAVGEIGQGLDRIRVELEAQKLATPPLVRELEATQERVRERKQLLADEIANLKRTREGIERRSGELDQLRTELAAKLATLTELQTTAATWNARVAEAEAEIATLSARIDSLARDLAAIADGTLAGTAVEAVTETHEPPAAAPSSADPPVEARQGPGHLLFVPRDDSYDLVERDGPPPAVGETIEVGDATWVVTKVGPSPLPYDERSCVFFTTP